MKCENGFSSMMAEGKDLFGGRGRGKFEGVRGGHEKDGWWVNRGI